MRTLLIAALAGTLGTVALPTAASAQNWRDRGDYREYRQDVRRAQRECRRDLRRADNRREYYRELRDCRRDLAQARRDYRRDLRDNRHYGYRDRYYRQNRYGYRH